MYVFSNIRNIATVSSCVKSCMDKCIPKLFLKNDQDVKVVGVYKGNEFRNGMNPGNFQEIVYQECYTPGITRIKANSNFEKVRFINTFIIQKESQTII